ncbi:MAG: hypothetical protein RJA70_1790 [Pseudomonadota bacterium]
MYWVKVKAQRFALREGETTVGRSRYCTIVLDTEAASREHAAIHHRGGVLTLTDLNSRNGTSLNGSLLTGPTLLKAGDRITVGGETIEIVETKTPPEGVTSTVETQLRDT